VNADESLEQEVLPPCSSFRGNQQENTRHPSRPKEPATCVGDSVQKSVWIKSPQRAMVRVPLHADKEALYEAPPSGPPAISTQASSSLKHPPIEDHPIREPMGAQRVPHIQESTTLVAENDEHFPMPPNLPAPDKTRSPTAIATQESIRTTRERYSQVGSRAVPGYPEVQNRDLTTTAW